MDLNTLCCPICNGDLEPAELVRCLPCRRSFAFDEGIIVFVEPAGYAGALPPDAMAEILCEIQDRQWRDVVYERFYHVDHRTYRLIADHTRTDSRFLIPLSAASRILVVGANWGGIAAALAEEHEVFIVDESREQLAFAARRLGQDGLKASMLACSPQTLPLRSGSVDAVVVSGLANWVGFWAPGSARDRRRQALEEFFRVLAPGGWIHLGLPARPGIRREIERQPVLDMAWELRGMDPDEVRRELTEAMGTAEEYNRLLDAAGFRVDQTYVAYPDHWLPEAFIPLGAAPPGAFFFDELVDPPPEGSPQEIALHLEGELANAGRLATSASSLILTATRRADQ